MATPSDYERVLAKYKRLRKAAKGWVRAEWYFRAGKRAYSEPTATWFEDAADNLREVVAGTAHLGDAGRALGCRNVKRK